MDRFLQVATPTEKESLMEVMNEMQLEEMQNTFNVITQTCFDRCVTSFRARALDGKERVCVNNCAEKFVAHMARVGQRFAEETMPTQTSPSTQQ